MENGAVLIKPVFKTLGGKNMSQMKIENIHARTNSVIEWLDNNEIALEPVIRPNANAILACDDVKMANILYSSMRGQVTLHEGHPLSGGGGNGYSLPQELQTDVTGARKDMLDALASISDTMDMLATGMTPKRVNKGFEGFTGDSFIEYLLDQWESNLTTQHKAGNWDKVGDSINWTQYHEQKEAQKNA